MSKKVLENRNILITGGSSKLGASFIQSAVAEGANIYTTYLHGKAIAEELKALGAKVSKVDLSKSSEVEAYARDLKTELKSLDVLIHNAAAVRDHTIKNLSESDWDDVLAADLKAPFLLTKKVLPLLFKTTEEGNRKKIFYITSRVAFLGGYGVSNYAAAKAGLIGLTKSLAQELGKKKILINAVNPGFMKSSMTCDLPEQVIQKNLNASPLGEWSNPQEVSDFLIFLCSDRMTQVTGQIFNYESRKI